MECFICSKAIGCGYLCEQHARELKDMLENKIGVIETPDWRHHCLICGEHKNRIIIEYPSAGYFCDEDICEEWRKWLEHKDKTP